MGNYKLPVQNGRPLKQIHMSSFCKTKIAWKLVVVIAVVVVVVLVDVLVVVLLNPMLLLKLLLNSPELNAPLFSPLHEQLLGVWEGVIQI